MRKLICPLLGALILSSMLYSAWLTSDWRTVLAATPAILGLIAVVAGLVAGVVFFGRHEVALAGRVAPSIRAQRESQRPAPQSNERKIRAALSEALRSREVHVKRNVERCRRSSVELLRLRDLHAVLPGRLHRVESAEQWPQRALPGARPLTASIGCGIACACARARVGCDCHAPSRGDRARGGHRDPRLVPWPAGPLRPGLLIPVASLSSAVGEAQAMSRGTGPERTPIQAPKKRRGRNARCVSDDRKSEDDSILTRSKSTRSTGTRPTPTAWR